jgi:DeoR/GlpR family transcriptional regulator of sugar metabolism
MLRSASQTILLADSSKFDISALIQVAPLQQIHKIVCDDGLPPEAIRAIEAEGVEVITPTRQPFGLLPEHIRLLLEYTTALKVPV